MSEIAKPEDGGLDLPKGSLPQTDSVVQLQEWAAELAAARQLAQVLATSSFLPMALRQKSRGVFKSQEELTYDAAAVILAGKSVGLDPMQSVQNIFPVHGQPSMYARTMLALVIAAGHEAKRTHATNESVTYKVRRKGDKDWEEFTWDIARARKAGYTSNAKYESDPIAMLGAKAAAEACRTVFPEVLLGMAYSAEEIELEDMGETPAPKAAPQQSAASRLAAAAAQPEPEPAANVDTGEIEPEPEPTATQAQQRKIAALLKEDGYTEKADMLDVMRAWTGRDISGAKDLTKAEADRFISEFEQAGNTDDGAQDTLDADADQAWVEGQSA